MSEKAVFGYLEALAFSLNVSLMLAYIFKVVSLKYNTFQQRNKLTLLPYYIVLIFLSVLCATDLV